MRAILDVILLILQIYVWLLIASAILSWLIAFNVVNTHNQFVATVADFLWRITEPVLRPIRTILPNLGGIDISPVILILIIFFIQKRDQPLHLSQRLLSFAGGAMRAHGRALDRLGERAHACTCGSRPRVGAMHRRHRDHFRMGAAS